MRIISGKKRGTKLYTLDGTSTRPTLDRVKEALFNIIQNNIKDAVFLDLFAGSGAIGLEALSRGAKKAIMCDNSKSAINIIKKNVDKLQFSANSILINEDFRKVLKDIKEEINIIFLDPPYESKYIEQSLDIIYINKKIYNNPLIIIETDDEERIDTYIDKKKYKIIDKRKYGRAYLVFIFYLERTEK